MVTCPHRRVYHTFMGSRFRVSKTMHVLDDDILGNVLLLEMKAH